MNIPSDYKSPKWHEATNIRNWKRSVPIYIRHTWHEFNDAHKAQLAAWAEDISGDECWE